MSNIEKSMRDIDARIENLIATQEDVEAALYRDEAEEDEQNNMMARIEEGYKALNRKLSSSEKNRWGYSPAGWMSKKLISKHLNSMKSGLYSVFPIPCKGQGCPYRQSCLAAQNIMEPPLGEPCVIEVAKIEQLIVGYANDFDINSSSATDRVLIQELIQIDLLMDRCQCLMSQEGDVLQEVTMGTTEDGEVYTQPVVSRYLDAWDRLSRRRQSLLDEMLGTRKSRKDLKKDPINEADVITQMMNHDKNLLEVEERPEKYRKKE